MDPVTKTIVIDAPLENIQEYLSEPQHVNDIWFGIRGVENVERGPEGGIELDVVYELAGMRFEGSGRTVEECSEKCSPGHHVIETTGDLPLTITWRYQRVDGSTKVTVTVEFEETLSQSAAMPLARLSNVFEYELQTTLWNLKIQLETS